MSNQEKIPSNPNQLDTKSLEDLGEQQHEALREKLELNNERERHTTLEEARAEALESAAGHEKEQVSSERKEDKVEHKRAITKQDKELSFKATMHEVRTQMSPTGRAFSKVIHQPVIEKTSEFIGSTVARPNAILSGSLVAFLFTATFYLIARFNGYPLSGSEAIASFALGWIVGIVIDYVRLLVAGKR